MTYLETLIQVAYPMAAIWAVIGTIWGLSQALSRAWEFVAGRWAR